jgi:hypothetical protein
MYKRDIINFLFIISFPVFGIGTYYSAIKSPSVGYLISIAPHLMMLLIYLIDLMYQREFVFRLNAKYFLMLLFLLSSIASLFVALNKGLPESNFGLLITKSLLLIVPFHSFLVLILYNNNRGNLLRLLLSSLSLLLIINLIGFYVLGMSNGVHSIDGRINFPFLDGFYSGASLLAIINLILLYFMQRAWNDPVRFAMLTSFFSLNFVLIFLINSRLTILVFILVLALMIFGALRIRGLYLLSMFTIPILLSSGVLIYKIAQLPGLSSLLQRVDVEDVTTFNGRAFLWKDAMDWLLYDQQGLIWGNGYKGHYFLGLISDVAKLWNEKDAHHMHLHSTSMEILVCQGVAFFIVFAILLYQVYHYYKIKNQNGEEEGAFLPVVIFLLFILQVDTFLYLDSLGFIIFSVLMAKVAINEKANDTQAIKLDKQNGLLTYLKFPAVGNMILSCDSDKKFEKATDI